MQRFPRCPAPHQFLCTFFFQPNLLQVRNTKDKVRLEKGKTNAITEKQRADGQILKSQNQHRKAQTEKVTKTPQIKTNKKTERPQVILLEEVQLVLWEGTSAMLYYCLWPTVERTKWIVMN